MATAIARALCQHPSNTKLQCLFSLSSWQFLCQVLAHTSIINSYYNHNTEKRSWKASRSWQKSAKAKYAQLQRFNRGRHRHCSGVFTSETKLIFRPSCIYYLIKYGKKSRKHQLTLSLVLALISLVYFTVLGSNYSGYMKIRCRNFIKRLKLNYLLCLIVLFEGLFC